MHFMERVGPLIGPFEFFRRRSDLLGGLAGLRLLGQKDSLDVGEYASLGDGHSGEEFVQFLVVTDGQLEVTGDDPGLLVVTGGVACQLENLGGQVLHDGGQVDWGSGADALAVVALAQVTVDTSDGELEPGPGAAGLALSLCLSSLSASRHGCVWGVCALLQTENNNEDLAQETCFYMIPNRTVLTYARPTDAPPSRII